MPFAESTPLRVASPRSDITVVYGRFTASASGATFTPTLDTMAGMTITGAAGVYVLTHRKCRFRMFAMHVNLPTITTDAAKQIVVQHVAVAGVDDAPAGVLNFNTTDPATGAESTPVDGAQIEVIGLLGF